MHMSCSFLTVNSVYRADDKGVRYDTDDSQGELEVDMPSGWHPTSYKKEYVVVGKSFVTAELKTHLFHLIKMKLKITLKYI